MTVADTTATVRILDEAVPARAPIWFRGRSFSTEKRFWYGTQRVIAPSETVARARRHFTRVGLTRLANITGLDRIGIPTVLSIRPNSPVLSVDAGKGFTIDAAMASAAMECIERFHAETVELPVIRAPYEQIAAEHDAIAIDGLPLKKHDVFNIRWPYRWTLGWDMVGQGEVAAPTAMVAMQVCNQGREVQPFQAGSNGLSSGNTFLEAVEGGLLEVVERDAAACHRLAWDRYGRSIPRVRPETITHPLVLELFDRFDRTGMAAVLFDCTVDTAVPVYLAYLYDRRSRHIGIYSGCGAHLDPEIAMVRALTEAVQSRLIFIAGSRDDFFRHSYLRLKHDDDASTIARLEAIPAQVDARTTVSSATPTFEGDVHIIIDRLRAAGLTQVLVYDLTLPGFDVSAVRVIVPGLEGYLFSSYAPGRRAKAFLKECSQ